MRGADKPMEEFEAGQDAFEEDMCNREDARRYRFLLKIVDEEAFQVLMEKILFEASASEWNAIIDKAMLEARRSGSQKGIEDDWLCICGCTVRKGLRCLCGGREDNSAALRFDVPTNGTKGET